MPIHDLERYRFPSKLQHRAVSITIAPELFSFAETAAFCEQINDTIEDSDMLFPKKCDHDYEWQTYCGARVCNHCEDHAGLERCFCGWSKSSPGRGRQELEDMGEVIEDDG